MLKLLRLVRNTIHNNGFYFSESVSKATDEATYKSVTYTFSEGKHVDFINWTLILDLVDDIEQMLIEMVNSPVLASMPSIPDPAASVMI
jgi:hypothetical protein